MGGALARCLLRCMRMQPDEEEEVAATATEGEEEKKEDRPKKRKVSFKIGGVQKPPPPPPPPPRSKIKSIIKKQKEGEEEKEEKKEIARESEYSISTPDSGKGADDEMDEMERFVSDTARKEEEEEGVSIPDDDAVSMIDSREYVGSKEDDET